MSSLRPRAYICVFSDNPTIKKLTAINFGVYCFPRSFSNNADEFVSTLGTQFIPRSRPEACIMHLELEKDSKIVNHRISRHKK